MRKRKNVKFIVSLAAAIVFAVVAATGLIIYFAGAAASYKLPLALIVTGGAGTVICLALMFLSIPKQPQEDEPAPKNGEEK